MKLIKFRAWNKKRKEMNYDTWEEMCESDCCYCYTQAENKIMFWTGLKDKNKKEIYEGDIVTNHFFGKDQEVWEVFFDKPSASFLVQNKEGRTRTMDFTNTLKILGNIYENTKLKEEKG